MDSRTGMILASVFAFFSSLSLAAASTQLPFVRAQRLMKYTSRSADEAKAWQKAVREKLFQQLRLENPISRRDSISLDL